MSNLVAPFTALAALGGAIVYGMGQEPQPVDTQVVQIELPDMSTSNTWMLSGQGTDEVCLITKTDRISSGTMKLDVDPTCAELTVSMLDIEAWQQDQQGNVSLVDNQGISIYQFAAGEEKTDVLTSIDQQNLELAPLS